MKLEVWAPWHTGSGLCHGDSDPGRYYDPASPVTAATNVTVALPGPAPPGRRCSLPGPLPPGRALAVALMIRPGPGASARLSQSRRPGLPVAVTVGPSRRPSGRDSANLRVGCGRDGPAGRAAEGPGPSHRGTVTVTAW